MVVGEAGPAGNLRKGPLVLPRGAPIQAIRVSHSNTPTQFYCFKGHVRFLDLLSATSNFKTAGVENVIFVA